MRIGIVTIYDSFLNCGAFLQAYALKKVLQNEGHTVYHIVREKKERFYYSTVKNYIDLQFSEDVKLNLTRRIKILLRIFRYIFNCSRKHFVFSKEFKTMTPITVKQANKMELDCIIFGSDEIWNIKNTDLGDEFYFGKQLFCKNKIAYAPSVGNSDYEDLKNAIYPAECLSQFKKIYVRDVHSADVIERLIGVRPDIVCDPTILSSTAVLQQKEFKIKEPYILVYSYGLDKKTIGYLKRFASEKKLELVSVTMKHGFADKNLTISPLMFGNIIKNAEYVLTTTLHGTIFTLLNKKKAAFYSGKYNDSTNEGRYLKTTYILKTFKQENRILGENYSYDDFCKIIEIKPNAEMIDNIIKQQAELSIRKLESTLDEL